MADPGFGKGRPPCAAPPAPPDTYAWPAKSNSSSAGCYHHQKKSEAHVDKWIQNTRVSDWMCPPGGMMTEPCNDTAPCGQPSNYVSDAKIFAPGHGYINGETLTVAGGSGGSAQVQITGVTATGGLKEIAITAPGNYSSDPATPNAPTGGSGSGASISLTFSGRIYSATGIVPYVRFSDSGNTGGIGDLPCPQPPNRCDEAWPSCFGGDLCTCPNPCVSPCDNTPGKPKCNAWLADLQLNTQPVDWSACHVSDARNKISGFNCFQKDVDDKTVDLTVCRKMGFKNIQAWKAWHGKFGYLSHDNPLCRVDLVRSLLIGTANCDGSGSASNPCNPCDIEFEQPVPDNTRYRTERTTCDLTVTGGQFPGGASLWRKVTVNRYSGIKTFTSSPDPDDLWYQYARQFPALEIAACCTGAFCNCIGPCSTGNVAARDYSASIIVGLASYIACQNGVFGCAYDFEVASAGSVITYTAFQTGTSQIYTTMTVDTSTGHLTSDTYHPDGSLEFHTDLTFSDNTHYTHHSYGDGIGSFGGSQVDIVVTGTLSEPYTSNDCDDDWVTLRKTWNLADDLVYPWRRDEFCAVAPVVHYSEPFFGVEPSPTIWPTPADQPTDNNALFYDGTIRGAPLTTPGVDRGYFDFGHKTVKVCCSDTDNVGTYVFAYGAFAGEVNAEDPTDGVIPKCATEWTENYNRSGVIEIGGVASCGGVPYGCSDGFPHGPSMGYPNLLAPFPCNYSPGALPPGAWRFYLPGGVLYGQEWAEIKIPRRSYNFDRPCGDDKFLMDETTVRCVKAGSTMGSMQIDSLTAINSGDQVWVCGVGGVKDGVYTATKTGSTTYSIAGYVDPKPFVSNRNCGTGIIGKLRFPTAPACAGLYNDDQPKGEFVYAAWGMNCRDYQERQRVIDQYATCACPDAQPASTHPIRYNQTQHGMPQYVNAFTATQDCLSFTVCDPQVMAVTSNAYDAVKNPTGENFTNAKIHVPPVLALDGRYGSMQQSAYVQHITDPLWQVPHKPCETFQGNQVPTPCGWVEDSGFCDGDDCVTILGVTSGNKVYPRRPYVENRLTVPSGAQPLPPGIYIGYLTLVQLDTLSVVNGNILVPPAGVGYLDPANSNNHAIPIPQQTPWGIYIREIDCECVNGRFKKDYLAQGVSAQCP